ncbi:MAG TPA: SRPBCC domain-containing protein [Gemmatimonadaceae bacterium]|nr:SRPBCC domain-containing protein [Gemmatimonadaceae bacterium]
MSATVKNPTTVARTSERELTVTRTFNAPAHIVFEAWSKPELIMRWWVPESFGFSFVSCDADVRTGGTYRFVFRHPDFEQPMAFFGRYLEVIPNARIVLTNEEGGDGPITTVTFEERDGKTLLVLRELYPSKQALDDAIASGSSSTGGAGEQFDLLDEVIGRLTHVQHPHGTR